MILNQKLRTFKKSVEFHVKSFLRNIDIAAWKLV